MVSHSDYGESVKRLVKILFFFKKIIVAKLMFILSCGSSQIVFVLNYLAIYILCYLGIVAVVREMGTELVPAVST